MGETSAIGTNPTLVGAGVCLGELGHGDLEVFFLWVVGDGGSASEAWRSVAASGDNSHAAHGRFPTPVLSVVSVHAGGRVEAFHGDGPVDQPIHLPWAEHRAGDCKRKTCGL